MKKIKNIILTTLIVSNISTNILSSITYASENSTTQVTNVNKNNQITSSSNLVKPSPTDSLLNENDFTPTEIDNLWDDGDFTPPPSKRNKDNRIRNNKIKCSSKWKHQYYFI